MFPPEIILSLLADEIDKEECPVCHTELVDGACPNCEEDPWY